MAALASRPPEPLVSLGTATELSDKLPAQLHVVLRAPKATAVAVTALETVDQTSALKCTRAWTSFWTAWHVHLSPTPPLTHRVACSPWWPC